MYKIAKSLSPFTLGLVFCCSQAALSPAARAASLKPDSSVDASLLSNPNITNQAVLDSAASNPTAPPAGVASVDCPLQPELSPSQGSAAQTESTVQNSGITPVSKNSADTSLKYQSNEIARSDVPSTESPSKTTQAAARTSPTLIAQAAAGDCCGIGGATTCEVGGLPTGGAGLGGISPLLGLLGLLPAAAIIPAISGDNNNNNNSEQPAPGPIPPAPVPESSSTGAIVAGFGMVSLLLSRRYLSSRKNKNVSPE